MGWETSDRRQRLPRNWPAICKRVYSLYGGVCANPDCDSRASEVDHIVPGDDHSLGNLQPLCGPHHREKTLREAHAANRQKQAELRALKKRPQESHPGSLKRPAKPLTRRGW